MLDPISSDLVGPRQPVSWRHIGGIRQGEWRITSPCSDWNCASGDVQTARTVTTVLRHLNL